MSSEISRVCFNTWLDKVCTVLIGVGFGWVLLVWQTTGKLPLDNLAVALYIVACSYIFGFVLIGILYFTEVRDNWRVKNLTRTNKELQTKLDEYRKIVKGELNYQEGGTNPKSFYDRF